MEVIKIVNLKEKPFNLNPQQIEWVEDTIGAMSVDEKIGQLFIHMSTRSDAAYVKKMTEEYHVGGIRFMQNQAQEVLKMITNFQVASKIPVFAVCNLEAGADSALKEATKVASHAQCGASSNLDAAYQLGRISAKEASAVGCNWNFGPVADIAFNWRNTIINTRSFGIEAKKVLECSLAYIKGIKESSMLSCAKHFPGDGVDERDQHLLLTVNDLSCEEWDASFGSVYKALIEDGVESIMVGHIALPAYAKKLNPQLEDHEMLPATLSPEIVNGLLRNQLGFQGLVITDASHMGGLLSAMPRSEQVPGAIAAGCDMFLFAHDAQEDIGYMKAGYETGIITDERLRDALMRILGMKAKLGLPNIDFEGFAQNSNYSDIVGCREHKEIAQRIADETVTLVKDTAHILPISLEKPKKARLYYLENAPKIHSMGCDPVKHIVKEELERAGFYS